MHYDVEYSMFASCLKYNTHFMCNICLVVVALVGSKAITVRCCTTLFTFFIFLSLPLSLKFSWFCPSPYSLFPLTLTFSSLSLSFYSCSLYFVLLHDRSFFDSCSLYFVLLHDLSFFDSCSLYLVLLHDLSFFDSCSLT